MPLGEAIQRATTEDGISVCRQAIGLLQVTPDPALAAHIDVFTAGYRIDLPAVAQQVGAHALANLATGAKYQRAAWLPTHAGRPGMAAQETGVAWDGIKRRSIRQG